ARTADDGSSRGRAIDGVRCLSAFDGKPPGSGRAILMSVLGRKLTLARITLPPGVESRPQSSQSCLIMYRPCSADAQRYLQKWWKSAELDGEGGKTEF